MGKKLQEIIEKSGNNLYFGVVDFLENRELEVDLSFYIEKEDNFKSIMEMSPWDFDQSPDSRLWG